MTLAPGVVSPEMDSNAASVNERSSVGDNSSGSAPAKPSTVHNNVTTIKPSRNRNPARARQAGNQQATPSASRAPPDCRNANAEASLL